MEAAAGGSTEVIEKRHPMDDITGRAPSELVTPVRNKLIVVAYGVAEQPTQGQTLHDVEIQARYAKVGVDRVADGWENLKLEIPEGDGKESRRSYPWLDSVAQALHKDYTDESLYIGCISSRLKGMITYAIYQGTLSTTRQVS